MNITRHDLHQLVAGYSAATNGRLINLMGFLLFVALAVVVDTRYFWVAVVPILATGAAYLADLSGEVSLMWASIALTVLPYGALLWLGVGQ